jgi:hypothetical protein
MGAASNEAMLLGLEKPSAKKLDQYATTAIATFLAAFGATRRAR